MFRFVKCCLVAVLFTSACGLPSEGEDNALEKSRLATEMAREYSDLDAPVAFQFEAPLLSSEGMDPAGFPRWYCPKSIVTRAQLASFIARTVQGAGGPLPVYDGRFSDVTSNNLHASAIEYVAEEGISDGCATGAFCPNDGVTRGQMALFTVRMMHGADYILPTPTGRYADVPTSHPLAAAIEQLAQDGIDVGCDAANFCPDRPVSRDEVAAFLVPAKYRNGAPPSSSNVFADVAPQNPNLEAVNVLAHDGVTFGCEAPNAGFRLHGEPLTDRQRNWILYFAGRTLPRLAQAYGDTARAFTVGARVIWWSLKEGVFGTFDDPFRHSLCNGQYITPFETCPGEWEVGLTAVHVPGAAEVQQATAALYPGQSTSEVARELLEFGRSLSETYDAGEYPDYATDRVMTDAALLRSWLARDATIGAFLMIGTIERDCFEGSATSCYGNESEASRDFALNAETASAVQTDIRRILVELRPR